MLVAKVFVKLKDGILDPQGQTVQHALENLGYDAVQQVRMGKLIELKLEGVDREQARQLVDEACRKLLANPVIENYTFELEENGAQ